MTLTDRISGLSASVAVKAPVRCATTENITLSGLQTVDAVVLVADDRVLVKNQTTTTKNGIYYASTGDWIRAEDFDGTRDVVTGTTVFVVSGTENGGEYWYVSTSGDPAPGEAMAFTQAVLGAGVTTGTIATQNANNVAITGGSVTGITDIVVADGGTGRSSLTADAVLVGAGTSPVRQSTVQVSTLGEISSYRSKIVTATGTTLTLSEATHCGRTTVTTSTAAVTVTLPNSLPVGFCAKLIQAGAGQVTFSASSGATLQNSQSHVKMTGIHAAVVLEVRANATGTAAIYNLSGDTSS